MSIKKWVPRPLAHFFAGSSFGSSFVKFSSFCCPSVCSCWVPSVAISFTEFNVASVCTLNSVDLHPLTLQCSYGFGYETSSCYHECVREVWLLGATNVFLECLKMCLHDLHVLHPSEHHGKGPKNNPKGTKCVHDNSWAPQKGRPLWRHDCQAMEMMMEAQRCLQVRASQM